MIQNLGRHAIVGILWMTFGYASPSYNIQLSQDSGYISEPVLCTLTLNYSNEDNITKIQAPTLEIANFWTQELNNTSEITNDNTVKKYNYLIFPQKNGTLQISNQTISIAQKDTTNYRNIWRELKTDKIKFISTKLPQNIYSIGDFIITAATDKNQTKSNAPIHLKITIQGYGNLEDIKPLALNLNKQQVYSTKPILKSKYKNGKYNSKFIQNFTIISKADFLIEPIEFRFFDTATKSIKTLSTEKIDITITDKPFIGINTKNILFTLLGILLGAISTLLYIHIKQNKKIRKITLKDSIKRSKNDKALYDVILPYTKELEGTNFISNLEQNIYHQSKIKINKKELIKHLEAH